MREAVYNDRLGKAINLLDNKYVCMSCIAFVNYRYCLEMIIIENVVLLYCRIARVAEKLPTMVSEEERREAEDYMHVLELAKEELRLVAYGKIIYLGMDRMDWLSVMLLCYCIKITLLWTLGIQQTTCFDLMCM